MSCINKYKLDEVILMYNFKSHHNNLLLSVLSDQVEYLKVTKVAIVRRGGGYRKIIIKGDFPQWWGGVKKIEGLDPCRSYDQLY